MTEPSQPVIDAATFIRCAGYEPIQDDLERCNCHLAGQMGHADCGWDEMLRLPVFIAKAVRFAT